MLVLKLFTLAFAFVGVYVIYNLILHPLARIPGPKLAAMTRLYQTFWSYYNGRSIYYQKVAQMHKVYGPIVRVGPNELSFCEEDDFKTIYSVRSDFEKDIIFYRSMGALKGMFGAVTKAQHQALRSPWSRPFSKPKIWNLYSTIEKRVVLLHERMVEESFVSGQVPVQVLLHAMTMDIVSECTLSVSLDLLKSAHRAEQCTSEILDRARWIWVLMSNRAIYWTLTWVSKLASRFPFCQTELDSIFQSSTITASTLFDGKSEYGATKIQPEMSLEKTLSILSITDDLYSFNVAGAFNLGTTTSITFYYILSDRSILDKLRKELASVAFEASGPKELEGLQYLSACIMEGLRLGYGPIGRLPRVVPVSGAWFRGYRIPAKTVVGVWAFVQHHNPDIWGEDHASFNPDRWLDKERALRMRGCLMSFGVDSRQCIGKELALMTMRLTLTMLVKNWSRYSVHGNFSPHDLDDYFASLVPKKRPRLELCGGCCSPTGNGDGVNCV